MLIGYTCSGLYGYSHAFGGYPGGQAEYVRIAWADANAFPVPDELTDEQALFLTDIFPTGYQAADQANIQPGDTVAIWGCGPVGWFAIQSAYLLGAERVIAIDRVPDRLERARALGADTINLEDADVVETLKNETGGRGPDVAIDCVGMEAHSHAIDAIADKVKQTSSSRSTARTCCARRSTPSAKAARCRCRACTSASSTSSRWASSSTKA